MKQIAAAALLLFFLSQTASAQKLSNFETRKFVLNKDSIRLDSLVIVKGSVLVAADNKVLVEQIDYRINYFHSAFINIRIPLGTQVEISYRTLTSDLSAPYKHKTTALIQEQIIENRNPFLYNPNEGGSFFSNDGLKMNGSLSRGLSFGNNQNVVLNSNLNLQLAGRLNNDIDILAAISDENNPIQPEGNTQQLQDFDKVFIRASKNNTVLTVGDFEMKRPDETYFMNYFKKSRGLQFSTTTQLSKKNTLSVGGEGALSRGRFARNIIGGIEGNQGPYRLSGQNGELYIIIISGTEAVYIDGEKMTRGEQNDYTIDYNSGEITFMPKRIITQYSRIVVEFQYSDRNYARSVFHLSTDYTYNGKYRIKANYFIEQDNRTQPLLQNLSDSNISLLASVGDRLNDALVPSERKTAFVASRILYRKIDTLGYANVYVFTQDKNSDSVFYELQFALVGQGKGNYIQARTDANGRVFQWVAPVGGVRQGNYEPVTQLISPKRRQMYTIGADWQPRKGSLIGVELVQSDNDINLFSDKDKGNDKGYGVKLNAKNTSNISADESNGWKLSTEASYEYVDKNFRYIERYRNVEFDRIWNRQLNNGVNSDTGFEEHISFGKVTLQKSQSFQLYYQLGSYLRDKSFSGWQHLAGSRFITTNYQLLAETEWLDTKDNTKTTQTDNEVRRYKAEAGRRIYSSFAGAKLDKEISSFKWNGDTLLPTSFAFTQYAVYLKNADSTQLKYLLQYTEREDELPKTKEYATSTLGRNFNANAEYTQENGNRFTLNANYRQLIVKDTTFSKLAPEKTVLVRLEYDYGFFRRLVVANTYYQVGSGQELRRDFQYIEVFPGQGVYVWKDFNNDGIKQLNEFVVASFIERNQANYIKVFLPTTFFIPVNTNQFSQTLNINPSVYWGNQRGLKKFIARFYNQTGVKLDRKTTRLSTYDFLNPLLFNIPDSQQISLSSLVRNTLFFNRSNPTFGCDYGIQENRSRSFLTNGFEQRTKLEHAFNIRYNFSQSWGISMAYNKGFRRYNSEFFAVNNFNYYYDEIKPKCTYQFNQQFRVSILFGYFESMNAIEYGGQKGVNRETGIEIRYALNQAGVVNAKYSYYKVAFNGDISSPVGYDMLNGFSVGENMVWNVNYQQRLGGNLQINMNYDARKTEGSPIIHVGRMEARYLF